MSIRIPGYQKLCETLEEGDLLEIVNDEVFPQVIVLDGNYYGHQLIPSDASEFEPQSFRLLPKEGKSFIVEKVTSYDELDLFYTQIFLSTSLFVDEQSSHSFWEKFIRLRDTDYRLWWITSTTFVTLPDGRVKCFVNGKVA